MRADIGQRADGIQMARRIDQDDAEVGVEIGYRQTKASGGIREAWRSGRSFDGVQIAHAIHAD